MSRYMDSRHCRLRTAVGLRSAFDGAGEHTDGGKCIGWS